MNIADNNTTAIALAVLNVLQTALLVYQSVRVSQVHTSVNGAKEAAVLAAHRAGVIEGRLK